MSIADVTEMFNKQSKNCGGHHIFEVRIPNVKQIKISKYTDTILEEPDPSICPQMVLVCKICGYERGC